MPSGPLHSATSSATPDDSSANVVVTVTSTTIPSSVAKVPASRGAIERPSATPLGDLTSADYDDATAARIDDLGAAGRHEHTRHHATSHDGAEPDDDDHPRPHDHPGPDHDRAGSDHDGAAATTAYGHALARRLGGRSGRLYRPVVRELDVTFSGLGGGVHNVACSSSVAGQFAMYTTSVSPSADCVFGTPGASVWVTVDGVLSNTVVW